MVERRALEYRFGVGAPTGRRSSIWKLCVNKNDIYLLSRMMGRWAKYSFHESGRCSFSATSEWVVQYQKKNQERHFDTWKKPEPSEKEAVRVFRIVIPESEIRAVSLEEDASKVRWFSVPKIRHARIFDVYELAPGVSPESFPIFEKEDPRLSLGNGGLVVVLPSVERTDDELLNRSKLAAIRKAEETGIELKPWHRMNVGFVKNDIRGVFEVVPTL